MPSSTTASFASLLAAQVRNEFTASQQYAAVAVWFDNHDLPRLAAHFYRQSVEERNHAMMMVRHLLDRELPVTITGVDDVRNEFTGGGAVVQKHKHHACRRLCEALQHLGRVITIERRQNA